MYLVQAVKDNDITRAINCAEEWRLNKFNSGFDTPKNLYDEVSYIIFNISEDYSTFETDKGVIYDDNDTNYVCILENKKSYYALLELF
jgi:hypothetical protein